MQWAAARERLAAAIFTPLRPVLARLPAGRFPTHEELTALAAHVRTAGGMPVRFVAPRAHHDRGRRDYERHIATTGEVETRPENWHDLFNALAWITWPRSKSAINAQHAAILEERGEAEARRRSPERDALTLFDEGGVIVASSDPEVFALIDGFEWKELFWRRRERLAATTRFVAFGHACLEQALTPYLGMVAKTVFVPADPALLRVPIGDALERIDLLAAAHFADRSRFPSPRAMAPMPVLGVPGWHNLQDEAFYDDAAHFRSRKGS